MSSSCQDLVALLKDCLMRSDCVVKDGNLPSDCLRNHFNELPEECKSIRTALFNCKRGMVRLSSFINQLKGLIMLLSQLDMRRRMRGNNPGYVPPSPAGESPAVPASA